MLNAAHPLGVVALAGRGAGRCGRVEALELCGAQLQIDRSDVLGHVRCGRVVPGIGTMSLALGQQPGQRDLGRRNFPFGGELPYAVDDPESRRGAAGEARDAAAPVALGEIGGRADRAGQEAAAERAVGDQARSRARAVSAGSPASRSRVHSEYSRLHRGDRMDGVGPADGGRRAPRTGRGGGPCPPLYELGHRADRLLDRRCRGPRGAGSRGRCAPRRGARRLSSQRRAHVLRSPVD